MIKDFLSLGFEGIRESLKNKKKLGIDKKLRNKLRKKFAKENNLGNMIGRPKKLPLISSEKNDGKNYIKSPYRS